jgi:hypothetical protein
VTGLTGAPGEVLTPSRLRALAAEGCARLLRP